VWTSRAVLCAFAYALLILGVACFLASIGPCGVERGNAWTAGCAMMLGSALATGAALAAGGWRRSGLRVATAPLVVFWIAQAVLWIVAATSS
jgi:hypothetical protein